MDAVIDWQWVGTLAHKGLALASFGSQLTPRQTPNKVGAFGLAAALANGIGLLGIWTQAPNYGEQALRTINAYEDWLRESPTIIAGDFNVAPNGTDDTRTRVLQRIFTRLNEFGYSSVYHHYFNEEYGAETRPTYFHRRKPLEPFHIDYCFADNSLLPQIRHVEVGTFARWVDRADPLRPGYSDHVPTIVDFDI